MAMSTKKQKIDTLVSSQLTIFDMVRNMTNNQAPAPGSFDISRQFRESLTEALKLSSGSRYEAAARMSELLGSEVTKTMIDAWTAESKEGHRFPAEYLAAFCQVTNSIEPLRIIAGLVKCHLVESKEALLVELARIDQAERELSKRKKIVRDYLNKFAPTGQ